MRKWSYWNVMATGIDAWLAENCARRPKHKNSLSKSLKASVNRKPSTRKPGGNTVSDSLGKVTRPIGKLWARYVECRTTARIGNEWPEHNGEK